MSERAPPEATAIARLVDAARGAASRAYAPYSKFAVGAACLTSSGSMHAGCNVENASYGLTMCAERAAIFAAVAAGERDIRCIVIYTPTPSPTTPCGACRQVIAEFGPDARVVACCDGAEVREWPVAELLPAAFVLREPQAR